MDSGSSSTRIFSTSLCLMAALIPRRTLRRSSSLERMASTRSSEFFRQNSSSAPRFLEYSRPGKGTGKNDAVRRQHRAAVTYLTEREWLATFDPLYSAVQNRWRRRRGS